MYINLLITMEKKFVKPEIKLQTAESKYTNIKVDFGISFGFLYIGYNKTAYTVMIVLVQMRKVTVQISF